MEGVPPAGGAPCGVAALVVLAVLVARALAKYQSAELVHQPRDLGGTLDVGMRKQQHSSDVETSEHELVSNTYNAAYGSVDGRVGMSAWNN